MPSPERVSTVEMREKEGSPSTLWLTILRQLPNREALERGIAKTVEMALTDGAGTITVAFGSRHVSAVIDEGERVKGLTREWYCQRMAAVLAEGLMKRCKTLVAVERVPLEPVTPVAPTLPPAESPY